MNSNPENNDIENPNQLVYDPYRDMVYPTLKTLMESKQFQENELKNVVFVKYPQDFNQDLIEDNIENFQPLEPYSTSTKLITCDIEEVTIKEEPVKKNIDVIPLPCSEQQNNIQVLSNSEVDKQVEIKEILCHICASSKIDIDNYICCKLSCVNCQIIYNRQRIFDKIILHEDDLKFKCCFCHQSNKGNIDILYPYMNQKYAENFDKVLLKQLVRNQEDYKACPKKDCGFFGYVEPKLQYNGCEDKFKCDKCDYEWVESGFRKKSCFEKLKNCLSSFVRYLVSSKCPNPKCGQRIIKNGGCPHMTCSVCKQGFCWKCKQSYNNHTDRSCQLVYFINYVTPIVGSISLIVFLLCHYLNFHIYTAQMLYYLFKFVLCLNLILILSISVPLAIVDMIHQIVTNNVRHNMKTQIFATVLAAGFNALFIWLALDPIDYSTQFVLYYYIVEVSILLVGAIAYYLREWAIKKLKKLQKNESYVGIGHQEYSLPENIV